MRLLIGNDFGDDLRDDRAWSGWWVQRVVWFARDGDVIVLPTPPDEAFFDYVTSRTGTRRATLEVLVAPTVEGAPSEMLVDARLSDPEFVAAVRNAIRDRPVESVVALFPDPSIARIVAVLGLSDALPGAGFVGQDGGRLVNSKTVFRAIADGLGVPTPRGAVCASPPAVVAAIHDLLDTGAIAVVKQDYLSGGRGNEVVTAGESFRPIGARRVVTISGDYSVEDYVRDRWAEMTAHGRNRLVVERYFRDSSAFFAEFDVTDAGVRLGGTGELLSAPFAIGQMMPPQGLDDRALAAIVDGGARLSEALRGLGYRGRLSADAIVTPEGEVYFTEYNGRVTGSTHVYDAIAHCLLGDTFGRDRLILERVWPHGWAVDSFADAAVRLEKSGLAYDPGTRMGVVLQHAYDRTYRAVMYCIVATDIDMAWQTDRQLKAVFGVR